MEPVTLLSSGWRYAGEHGSWRQADLGRLYVCSLRQHQFRAAGLSVPSLRAQHSLRPRRRPRIGTLHQ